MGYTHYFSQVGDAPTDAEWKAICESSKKIILEFEGLLCFEYDEPETKPHIGETSIRFNGRGNDGHETFIIDRGMRGFKFCKTARKPYDDAVVRVLRTINKHAPNWLELSSDGDEEGSSIF